MFIIGAHLNSPRGFFVFKRLGDLFQGMLGELAVRAPPAMQHRLEGMTGVLCWSIAGACCPELPSFSWCPARSSEVPAVLSWMHIQCMPSSACVPVRPGVLHFGACGRQIGLQGMHAMPAELA